MKKVTIERMRAIDQRTIKNFGLPALILMEHAGKAVAEQTLKFSKNSRLPVTIVCGTGNNGGDGLVAARWLHHLKRRVSVFLLGTRQRMSPETKTNFTILKKLTIAIHPLNKNTLLDFMRQLNQSSCIVDALLGTGTRSPISGIYQEAIELINQSSKSVVSVDLPSGFDADAGTPFNSCVRADLTVTLGFPKVGFQTKGAKKYTGKVIVADIGLIGG